MLGLLAAGAATAAGDGDLERAVRALKAKTEAEVLCGLNASKSSASENVLVWQRLDGTLGAIVFRTTLRSATAPEEPCWMTPGHCAVFKGRIDAPSSSCDATNARAAFVELSVPGVRTLRDPGVADKALMRFAHRAHALVRGVRADEHEVGLLADVPFYAARNSDGTRRVRITPQGAQAITISRLEIEPSRLNLATLRQAARELRTRNFELAGPRGALAYAASDDPRVAVDGQCVRLVPPWILRLRLERGHRRIPDPEPPPAAGEDTLRAYNEWVQALLEWDGTQAGTRQHPAIALYRKKQERTCS